MKKSSKNYKIIAKPVCMGKHKHWTSLLWETRPRAMENTATIVMDACKLPHKADLTKSFYMCLNAISKFAALFQPDPIKRCAAGKRELRLD